MRLIEPQKRHHMLNKFVIVRTQTAGVHVGTLKEYSGKEAILVNSSRIWRWFGANTLDDLAVAGASEERTKISAQAPLKVLTEVIEIILCTETATENLSRPRWSRE
jgi:hypothetical protein